MGEGKVLGVRRIFARISSNLPETFCAVNLCLQIFSHKNREDIFWYDLKKGLHVFSTNVDRHFLKSKNFLAPFLPRLSGTLLRFSEILPGFSTNQNFWECACTPAAYNTFNSCSSVLNETSLNYFRKIFCSQVSHCRCYVLKHVCVVAPQFKIVILRFSVFGNRFWTCIFRIEKPVVCTRTRIIPIIMSECFSHLKYHSNLYFNTEIKFSWES